MWNFLNKGNLSRAENLRQGMGALGQKIYRDASSEVIALVAGLDGLGVGTDPSERNVHLERVFKHWWQQRKGSVRLTDGLIQWITILHRPRSKDSPPKWWTVFVVPDERLATVTQTLKIRTHRKKTFPLFGKVIDTTWKGNDHGIGLRDFLSNSEAVDELAAQTHDMKVQSYSGGLSAWAIQMDGMFNPMRPYGGESDWQALQAVATDLVSRPLG